MSFTTSNNMQTSFYLKPIKASSSSEGNNKVSFVDQLPGLPSLEQTSSAKVSRKSNLLETQKALKSRIKQLNWQNNNLIAAIRKTVSAAEPLLKSEEEIDREEMKKVISLLEQALYECKGEAGRRTEKNTRAEAYLMPAAVQLNKDLLTILNELTCFISNLGDNDAVDTNAVNEKLSGMRATFEDLSDKLNALEKPVNKKLNLLKEKIALYEKRRIPGDHLSSIAIFENRSQSKIEEKIKMEEEVHEERKKKHDELLFNFLRAKIQAAGISWKLKQLDLNANFLSYARNMSTKLGVINGKLSELKSLIRQFPRTPNANLLEKLEKIKADFLELAMDRCIFEKRLAPEVALLEEKIKEDEKSLSEYADLKAIYDHEEAKEIEKAFAKLLANIAQERVIALNDLRIVWDKIVNMIDEELFVEINRTHDGIINKSVPWKTTYKYFGMHNSGDLYLTLPKIS